jgi:hypothetical protein
MAENHESAPQMSKLTIEQVQEKYQNQLLSVSGVVGVGIGGLAASRLSKFWSSKRRQS